MKASKIGLIAAVIAGVMLAYTPSIRAQDAKDSKGTSKREGRLSPAERQERLTKMSEELKLNAEQKTKVEAAMKEQGEKMRGMRDLTPEERRSKHTAAREELNTKMKGILTAEQFTKWEKMREQRGPGAPGGEGSGARKDGKKKK